ncbi:MAG: hypothetical protein KA319_07315 [Ferruginibacter sp.]|nr:hypothetical protein [Ferruginibacter sp.]
MKYYVLVAFLFQFQICIAQSVAINNDGSIANASALLDIKSTNKGLLLPRVTKAQKDAIISPAAGLLVYQTSPDSIGFQYYDGTKWLWLQAEEDTYWAKNGSDIYNKNLGRVGIGTTNPLARLHIIDTAQFGVLFSGSRINSSIIASSTPVIGQSARMMWLPKQAAFRAGGVHREVFILGSIGDTTVWDDSNIGIYSAAFGRNTKASGDYSFAIGRETKATGDYSTAMGYNTSATGFNSTAMGYTTSATGGNSTAMGYGTSATGDNSTAMGYSTTANGYSSTVLGMYNNIIVSPQISITPTTPLFIIGNGDNAATRKNAFVVQKNGNIGVNISLPEYALHVASNNAGDGTWERGIMIENTAPLASVGEAAISFRNAAITPNKKWTFGINQSNTDIAIFYGTGFNTNVDSTRFSIDTTGNVGLSSTSNDVRLQINGAIAFERQTFNATLATTNITVGNRTYLRINSDDVNPANRKVTLTTGLVIGQMIIIHCISNSFRLEDTDLNLELQGTADYNLGLDDTITLIWDGVEWVELNRSNN